jgi:hypothetical protein
MSAIEVPEDPDSIKLNLNDQGLLLQASHQPDTPILGSFFAGYNRAFVLPDEREELDGFRECLTLNGRAFSWAPWPRSEMVMTLSDGSGQLLGGANFMATLIDGTVAVALNYIFVDVAARGRMLSRLLLNAVRRFSIHRLSGDRAIIFVEQNDPLRLTPEEYAADSQHCGLDQIDRLTIWSRLGAGVVDFSYVAPALSQEKAANDKLLYSAIGAGDVGLDPAFFRKHLISFLGVSILKGRDPAEARLAQTMLDEIRSAEVASRTIAVIDMDRALIRLRNGGAPSGVDTFRAFLGRRHESSGPLAGRLIA